MAISDSAARGGDSAPRKAASVGPVRFPGLAHDDRYYAHVERGYDEISSSYDDNEAANAVGRRARAILQTALFATFRQGDRVLEIGCGTGIDAIALGERGIHVLATDLSGKMIQVVRRRAKERGLSTVEARQLPAQMLGALVDEGEEGAFDGAFAHGGVFNMLPEPGVVVDALRRLIRPRGRLFCTIVNHTSLFEVLLYTACLRPRKAFRRLGRDVPIPITREARMSKFVIPTRFYAPRGFSQMFRIGFVVRAMRGMQIVLPPWNLADYMDRLNGVSKALELVEDRIGGLPPFRTWGSLCLIDFERGA